MERQAYLAIDLGASRLAAGVVGVDGDVLVRDRVTTPARNVWPVVTQLASRVLAAKPNDVDVAACGVTCPGPIDRATGSMKPVGMPAWDGFPLRSELGVSTGLPVEVDTPGRALAHAELWLGEMSERPTGEREFATLVLGDDVDGAAVSRGRVLDGCNGNVGQFGHLVVEPEGIACECGAVGCLTMYAGRRGIEAATNRELGRTPPALIERTGIMTARACASIAAMLDVADILVAGIVPSVLGTPFFDALDKELDQRSGLDHLTGLRVRGIAAGRIGPLVSAAAVARRAG